MPMEVLGFVFGLKIYPTIHPLQAVGGKKNIKCVFLTNPVSTKIVFSTLHMHNVMWNLVFTYQPIWGCVVLCRYCTPLIT